jgi:hypothetical protein
MGFGQREPFGFRKDETIRAQAGISGNQTRAPQLAKTRSNEPGSLIAVSAS